MKIPLRFPRELKKFRRGPDLLRRGESKAQESSANPWSKTQIAAQSFRGARGGGGGKEIGFGAPPPRALYIGELPGPDDPG